MLIEGVALARNRRVVHLQCVGTIDEPRQVWLWAGAVERVDDRPGVDVH